MRKIISRNILIFIAAACLILTGCSKRVVQSPFKGLENLFTEPGSYIIPYTSIPPVIDGDINNDNAWKQAKWTAEFGDIEGDIKPKPYLHTRVKMLWDDSCLYIAAQIEEPQLFAYQKQHDDIVYHDNDFEIFIDPANTTHQYYEFEVNALNTIFDLFLNTPYRDGGDGMINWNAEGLKSAVKVDGTINDPSDIDKGWTVEIAIPFKSITIGFDKPGPKEGTLWRINFSRVEWDTKVNAGKYITQSPEHNWTWTPQGIIAMHAPERWGYLQFSKNITDTFTMPYNEMQRRYLWLIYYKEHQYYSQHHSYALKLEQLGLGNDIVVNGRANLLQLEATPHQFMGFITDENDKTTWTIDQQGGILKTN